MEQKRVLMAYDNYFPSHIWVNNDIVYISTYGDGSDGKIMRRNLKSGLALADIAMPTTNSFFRYAPTRVTPDGDNLYFSYYGVYRYNLLTQNFFQFPRDTVSTPDGGYYFLPNSPNEIAINGDNLFVTDDDLGIAIIDKNSGITKAYFPMFEQANGSQPFRCSMLQIVNNRVYAASEQSITIFDLPENFK